MKLTARAASCLAAAALVLAATPAAHADEVVCVAAGCSTAAPHCHAGTEFGILVTAGTAGVACGSQSMRCTGPAACRAIATADGVLQCDVPPGVVCWGGVRRDLDSEICGVLLAIDTRLGTSEAAAWGGCEPYSPLI